MTADLAIAARTLALDLATGEVVGALDAAGIDCVVLKGPAMVRRLYGDEPGIRNYGDIDLAVDPRRFDDAGRLLATLGFEDHKAGIRAGEADRLQERPWHRDGAASVAVDLHRGFHHVTDWEAWWDMLTVHREVIVVEGQPVMIPDPVACALIAALHASKAASGPKPLEDLRRALQYFDERVWRQAGELAGSVGASRAFAAALRRLPPGAALATRLGLAATDRAAWFEATSVTRGVVSLSLLVEPGTPAARAGALRDALFPSSTTLVARRPMARHGRAGLCVARIDRLLVVGTRLPALLWSWHRTSRAVRRARAAPSAMPVPRTTRPD